MESLIPLKALFSILCMVYRFMTEIKIQNSIIKISWYVAAGLWSLFSLLSASIDPDETILDKTGIFLLVFLFLSFHYL